MERGEVRDKAGIELGKNMQGRSLKCNHHTTDCKLRNEVIRFTLKEDLPGYRMEKGLRRSEWTQGNQVGNTERPARDKALNEPR